MTREHKVLKKGHTCRMNMELNACEICACNIQHLIQIYTYINLGPKYLGETDQPNYGCGENVFSRRIRQNIKR